MTPVIYTAVDAAAVFHNVGLEGAENEYADVVAQEEKYRQHQKVGLIQYVQQIQCSENGVKAKPYEKNLPCLFVLTLDETQKLNLGVVLHRLICHGFCLTKCHGQSVPRTGENVNQHDYHKQQPQCMHRTYAIYNRVCEKLKKAFLIPDVEKQRDRKNHDTEKELYQITLKHMCLLDFGHLLTSLRE